MKEIEAKEKIIGFFKKSGGGFVSGEDISEELGFSRAGVWKYINGLREDGYIIEAVPHLGYTLKGSPDKMYGYDISCGLNTDIIGKNVIHYYESLDSTNNKAYELADKGEAEGTVVVAEAQTKGKGRAGREWISPGGGGIYMSLILRPDAGADEIPALTLIAAVSVVKALSKICNVDAKIKWPNDIMINGKKVCGILTEAKTEPDRVEFLVLGIGVNVNTSVAKLPPVATSLEAETNIHVDRIDLVRNILECFEENYKKFQKHGFAGSRDECIEYSLMIGKAVRIEEHHRKVTGEAVDIDEKGALVIRTEEGVVEHVYSGDVVLCRGSEGQG